MNDLDGNGECNIIDPNQYDDTIKQSDLEY